MNENHQLKDKYVYHQILKTTNQNKILFCVNLGTQMVNCALFLLSIAMETNNCFAQMSSYQATFPRYMKGFLHPMAWRGWMIIMKNIYMYHCTSAAMCLISEGKVGVNIRFTTPIITWVEFFWISQPWRSGFCENKKNLQGMHTVNKW